MKKWNLFLGIVITAMAFLTSCGGSKGKTSAKDAMSALIAGNTQIVGFGHVSAMEILNKTDYKNIQQANLFIDGTLKNWKGAIDMDSPIYFGVEAPFDKDGNPAATYAFLHVKNKDSLLNVLNVDMGYSMEKNGEMDFFQDNDVSFGVKGEILGIVIKSGEYNGKEALATLFEKSEGTVSEGKTQEILDQTGDVVIGASIERLFLTANTSLNKLAKAKQDELKTLVTDGYIKSVTRFENGKMSITTDHLFSDALKDKLFFNDKNGSNLVSKLGTGNPWMGLSLNLDMKKFEQFIMDYAPELNQKIIEKLPVEVKLMSAAFGGDKIWTNLFSGQLGFVATGNPSAIQGMELEFNGFLGLGTKGPEVKELATGFLSTGEKKGEGYLQGNILITPKNDGIYASSTSSTGNQLVFPSYANKFGKESFGFFLALEKMDIKSFELEDGANVVEIFKFVTFNGNKDQSVLTLECKSPNGNILKQVAKYYEKTLLEKMGGMAM